jgi:predicted O-methyltransferase YrrM
MTTPTPRSEEVWSVVDDYICNTLLTADESLSAALRDSEAAGLPRHNVAPNQGKLLYLLAKMKNAHRILEIGTLGGYSTIWLARALPTGGKLISLEVNPVNAGIATANIARAGLKDVVEIRLGAALDSLKLLCEEASNPFDLIFIDADKPNNPSYLEWSLKLAHGGTVIIGDNVVRGGAVAESFSTDPNVIGIRSFLSLLKNDSRLEATAIQTVGSKGYDGFSMAIVKGAAK